MTDLVPYAPPMLAVQTDSWVAVLADVARLAEQIQHTEFVPRSIRGNAPAIAATILYGREVGLAPMQALRSVHMIEGSPSMSAESMRGLVLAAGHDLEFIESNATRCRVRGRRRGSASWHEVEWSIETARQANLASRGPWRTYPRAMLKARATAELARDLFADVVGGFVAVEELDRLPDAPETPPQALASTTRVVARGEAPTPVTAPPRAPSKPAAPLAGPEEAGDHGGWSDVPLPVEEARPPVEAHEPTEPASHAQGRHVFALLNSLGIETRQERLEVAEALLGRSVESFSELTRADAHSLIETLLVLDDAEDGATQLAALVAHYAAPAEVPPGVDAETGEVLDDDAPPY